MALHPSRRWPVALVTGASSGIGMEIARQLAADGSDLVVVARSGSVLEELAAELDQRHGTTVEVLTADLSTEEGMERVADRISTGEPVVDLVVNNAGFGNSAAFGSQTWIDDQRMLRLNIEALTRLSHAAVNQMRPRRRGGILNISSVAAKTPAYNFATYGGSKSYVTAFTEALHEELRGSGVSATVVAPGFTRTGFQSTAGNEAEGMPGFMWQEASEVAAEALTAVARNRAVRVTGTVNKISVGVLGLIPRPLLRRTAKTVVERFSRSDQ